MDIKLAAGLKRAASRLLAGPPDYRPSRKPGGSPRVERANRASAADLDGAFTLSGSARGWAATEYGQYYATSVPVYAAIKMRVDALARSPP